jgi:CRISPR-associated endoribonuclease Cas6
MVGFDLRFRVTLVPWRSATEIPVLRYDYQHSMSSMLYNMLIDVDEKYKDFHDSKDYKFFTFSRLEIPRRRALKDGLAILCDDAYLWVSSPSPRLVRDLAGALGTSDAVKIGGLGFAVAGIASPSPFVPRKNETFRTMSPIIVRTTIQTKGETKTWDLSPDNSDFIPKLLENLHRKYEAFYRHQPQGAIEEVRVSYNKQQRIQILDTFHRAHLMNITMRGDPELIKFAYDCGLGEKNSMGFGMLQRTGT